MNQTKINIKWSKGTYSTPIVRCAWIYLAEKKKAMENANGTPGVDKYEVTLIMPKNDPKVNAFIDQISTEMFEMIDAYNQESPRSKLVYNTAAEFFKDGDTFDAEKYPYYQNAYIFTPKNKELPELFKKGVNGKAESIEPSAFKGGNLVRAVISFHVGQFGIGWGLKGLRFVADDGVTFGSTVPKASSHSDILADDDDMYEDAEINVTPEVLNTEVVKEMEAAVEQHFAEEQVPTPAPAAPAPAAKPAAPAPAARPAAPARAVGTPVPGPAAQAAPAQVTGRPPVPVQRTVPTQARGGIGKGSLVGKL